MNFIFKRGGEPGGIEKSGMPCKQSSKRSYGPGKEEALGDAREWTKEPKGKLNLNLGKESSNYGGGSAAGKKASGLKVRRRRSSQIVDLYGKGKSETTLDRAGSRRNRPLKRTMKESAFPEGGGCGEKRQSLLGSGKPRRHDRGARQSRYRAVF